MLVRADRDAVVLETRPALTALEADLGSVVAPAGPCTDVPEPARRSFPLRADVPDGYHVWLSSGDQTDEYRVVTGFEGAVLEAVSTSFSRPKGR